MENNNNYKRGAMSVLTWLRWTEIKREQNATEPQTNNSLPEHIATHRREHTKLSSQREECVFSGPLLQQRRTRNHREVDTTHDASTEERVAITGR